MQYPIPDAPSGVDTAKWAQAVAAIRGYCEWHIAPEFTETVTVDGPGGPTLILPTQRLSELVDVTSDGRAVSGPEWSASGVVRCGGWSSKFRGITATITHGYPSWPGDLESVARELVATGGHAGVSSVSSDDAQVRFEVSFNGSQRAVMDRYRLVGAP